MPDERPSLYETVKRLHALGHAPEFPDAGEAFLAWVFQDLGRELIVRYQTHHGLRPTGELCARTVEHLARPRCGHPDVMPIAGVSSWSIRSLAYYQQLAYPGVDPAEVAAEYAEAVRRVAAVCGLTIVAAASPGDADVVASMGPIDGEWNILALSELPPPDAPKGTVLRQTFDQAEVGLTKDQRVAMMAHEFCHCLGLGHATPGSGNLMEPVLSTIGSPQAGDAAELQSRYGPPAATPAGASTPTAPPAQAGPAVDSVLISCKAPGAFDYRITFPAAGDYLLLVVPR